MCFSLQVDWDVANANAVGWEIHEALGSTYRALYRIADQLEDAANAKHYLLQSREFYVAALSGLPSIRYTPSLI